PILQERGSRIGDRGSRVGDSQKASRSCGSRSAHGDAPFLLSPTPCPLLTVQSFQKALNHARPSAREIAAVVAAAAHCEDAPVAELVGERAEAARGMRMRLFGEAEMGDRISLQAVRAALKQDEFGAPLAQKSLRTVPSLE